MISRELVGLTYQLPVDIHFRHRLHRFHHHVEIEYSLNEE